jgi:FMN reductase
MSAITVVVGNPKRASRTRTVAEAVAARAGGALSLPAVTDDDVVELADLGPSLFDWTSADVRQRVEQLSASRLAVIATPIYKATYTGLLKAFLDWFGQTGLSGVTAIPVMVGAGSQHALAVEVHLRPVLIEIGARVPTRGVFVRDDELDIIDATLDAWAEHALPYLS